MQGLHFLGIFTRRRQDQQHTKINKYIIRVVAHAPKEIKQRDARMTMNMTSCDMVSVVFLDKGFSSGFWRMRMAEKGETAEEASIVMEEQIARRKIWNDEAVEE